MNISSMIELDLKNPDSVQNFLDMNAMDHETIYEALMRKFNQSVPHYSLWTESGISEDWLLLHDQEHRAISDLLTLYMPVDLTNLDANNVNDWVNDHVLAHSQINQALGLT